MDFGKLTMTRSQVDTRLDKVQSVELPTGNNGKSMVIVTSTEFNYFSAMSLGSLTPISASADACHV